MRRCLHVLSIFDGDGQGWGIGRRSGRRGGFTGSGDGGLEDEVVDVHDIRGGRVGVIGENMRFSELCDARGSRGGCLLLV